MPRKRVRRSPRQSTSIIAQQRGKILPEALGEVPADVAKLNWGERLDVLDAWVQVLDGVYAHLPLKRALYGFDPVRAIEHLRQQVTTLTRSSVSS